MKATVPVQIRLTLDQARLLKRQARVHEQKLSVYVREAALSVAAQHEDENGGINPRFAKPA